MNDKFPVISRVIELEPNAPPARFRYGQQRFKRDMIAASAMTVVLCLLIFMILVVAGNQHPVFYTVICALSFFLFISATSIYRFVTRQVIVSVTPAGLLDLRLGPDLIPWENIRDMAFSPLEGDMVLKIAIWSRGSGAGANTTQQVHLDLAALDRKPEEILEAIGRYKDIAYEFDSQKSVGH